MWGRSGRSSQLWPLATPEVTSASVILLDMYRGGLSRADPSGGNYTFVMTGSQFDTVLYSAAEGVRDFDIRLAYMRILRKNHLLERADEPCRL